MEAPCGFPLLVEGSWGAVPPKNLSTKLQLYFQSSKKSGGGECEVHQEPGNPPHFLVVFFPEDVRQRVLERENHELVFPGKGTFKLSVKLPTAPEKAHKAAERDIPRHESKDHVQQSGVLEEPKDTLLVAFENLKDSVTDMMLKLLVENISGLSSDEFEVEAIRDFDVAVVTFKKHIDVMKFVGDCAKHPGVKQLKLSARLLEVTKTIRVENLPSGVDDHHLKIFFENPQNGGGKVVNIECFPEENSAFIEFFDRKVLDTIITRKLDFNNVPLCVFPYYNSLGTTLYGKKKPLITLPAPFKETLALPVWKFLQTKNHLIEEINEEMRQYHCELTWPKVNGEVTIRPVASLLSQGRNQIQTWKKDTSTAFNEIKSKYKVTSFELDKTVWSRIKNDLHDTRFLVEFNAVMKVLNVVGKSEDIQKFEREVNELKEVTNKKIEREKQSVQEKMVISPGKYYLLCHSGVLKHLCTECPEVEMFYDEATQHMCLKGLLADVYKIKCDILEKVLAMVQKSLQVSPEVFQFLQEADCAEFSKSLFIAQKILTVYELEAATVLLTSCSPGALIEAEKKMVSALTSKHIDVEDNKVLSDKKWKELTSSLSKKYNSSSRTVFINELTSRLTTEVVITGYVREVNEVHGSLSDFLETHTQIEQFVEVKTVLVLHYLKNEMNHLWQKVKKANVQVIFNPEYKQNSILLIGPKTKVLEAVNHVTQARDSVCVKSIHIDKPGVGQFFRDNAQAYQSQVRNLCGCFFELKSEVKAGGGSDGPKCFSRTTLPSGVSLIVQQGNLTQFPVEVVVNSANEDLKHIGGLAAALLKAAGPELQADCDQIVKTKGKILPGSATISKAGKLPYRHVIHAVGPQWTQYEAQKCVDQLKRTVEECLHLAEEHKYQSIAIPAISSGIYGFPLPQCVETIVLALKDKFQKKSDGHTLKEIYLVDTAEKSVEAFDEAVKMLFKESLPESASLPSLPVTKQPHMGKDDGNRGILLTPEGLRVLLVKGDVQNAVTDVVVNSIPSDLALNRGPLSQALLNKAGPKLQEELNTLGQAVTVHPGTILQTSGYNLHCSHVLHVVAPFWSENSTSAHQIMEVIIRKCLDITKNLSLKSVTFPAIGTGTLGFPKSIFAKLIISEVFKFSSEYQTTTLQEVHLMLHQNDHENIQVFSDEFSQRTNGNSSSDKISQVEDTQGFYGTVSSPCTGMYEMKIGSIIYQVATGDIINEETDVIVNSTSRTFDHKAGVSKAILEGAGKYVEMQCLLQAGQGNRDYIVTVGGLLKCKNIIHVVGGNDVKKSVTSVLQESNKRNYSSICLPAIGTGRAKQNPDKVAEAIIDAIEDFIQKDSIHSVKTVKVVIFRPPLLNVFYDKMKKKGSFDSCQQSMISKTSSLLSDVSQSPKKQCSLVLEEKRESTFFLVCGSNAKLVEDALYYIQDVIERNQCSYTSEDECIKDFDEKEYQELNDIQTKLNIAISLDTKKPSIKVLGFGDVTHAKKKIEEMIKSKRGRSAKEQEFWAECINEFVEWQYDANNMFHSFDKITNLLLEEARRTNRKTIEVKINHQLYKVDLNTYTATGAQGHTLQVKRLTKFEVEIPAHWRDMNQQNVLVVSLQPSDPEYMTVASKFNQTCVNFKIEKIERIQNTILWNSYQTQKKTMDAKNGQIANEKQLFHGTDADSVPFVNTMGFNRSYAGKHAVKYGKGTYFAVNASYSANDLYSRPDINGKKHMYYVRVLTGMYTRGDKSLLVPPPKNSENPTDLYDTVTDNVQNPSLFVVFYDYQSYPEYLITFKQ
ncbi:protein mono-ADP-ribosyltransferase PARP14-like [Erinaceus europaeus]|uniref:Poly [ADP-ribose] polymerase n=1 Tax=Erinaceus europaeus TaxID=9365 RepID=A0ABM3XW96_ERIEU|nr:protein mono-ADP-ribosyltransferase PARP14-like [Erinaceus europaeus]